MPQIPNRSSKQFSRFDVMEDEQLQEFLRADASKPEGEESDMEEVLYVMELLANRKKQSGRSRDPVKAFEDFKKYYAPEDGLFPEFPSVVSHTRSSEKTHKRAISWRRMAIILAACLALMVGSILTASADQRGLWERIVKWTQETFHLGAPEEIGAQWMAEENYALPLADLKELLEQNKVSAKLIPTWIPDGYTVVETMMRDTPIKCIFHSWYSNENKSFTIEVRENYDNIPTQFEQLGSVAELYTAAGLTFHIFRNDAQLQAICVEEDLECWIYGDLTIEEIKHMIDSIKSE